MNGETVLDLTPLAGGQKIAALTGKERGIEARSFFGLDRLDESSEPVVVHVPEFIAAITSSFFLGLFSGSLRKFSSEKSFLAKYRFDASPAVQDQILNGIRNGLISRGPLIH